MKRTSLLLLQVAIGLTLAACSKDTPEPASAVLENSTWRMTAYTYQLGQRNGPAGVPHDFFKSYDYTAAESCLGRNTLEFTIAGRLLWNREERGCALYLASPANATTVEWGTWRMVDNKLHVSSPFGEQGKSTLPVMFAASDNYEVSQPDQATLVLGTSRIFGAKNDSVITDRAVFMRVK